MEMSCFGDLWADDAEHRAEEDEAALLDTPPV